MTAENKPKTLNGFDTQKIIELMLQPLPDKAYKKHPTKSYQTTISPDYTRERLTKIFGLFGIGWGLNWETHNTKEWTGQTTTGKDRYNFAIQQAEFWFSFGTDIISFPVTGCSDNDNLGDAMKGARTSCISDGAKQLLFQLHIYKNTDYQPPKFDEKSLDQNTGEVLSLPPIPEEKSQPAPKPTVKQNAGEVISPTQAAGFDAEVEKKADPWPAKEGLLFEFCQEVRSNTDHYKSQWQLLNAIGPIKGSLKDEDNYQAYFSAAIDHAKEKEAAPNG